MSLNVLFECTIFKKMIIRYFFIAFDFASSRVLIRYVMFFLEIKQNMYRRIYRDYL